MKRYALWIVLFVSLALNVFVVGAFVGARLTGGRLNPPPAGLAQELRQRSPVLAAVRELPPEAQAAWRSQMPEFAASNGPRMREARRLARETMRGFGREPFDPATVRADLERARALEHQSRLEMDRRLVAFAATLSPEDRSRFGEALARPRTPVSRRERPDRP